MPAMNWVRWAGWLLLTSLVWAHVFHLYLAWHRSKVPIVDAVISTIDRQALSNMTKERVRLVPGYAPLVYIDKEGLNLSFAVRSEDGIEAVLNGLVHDLFQNSQPKHEKAIPGNCTCASAEGEEIQPQAPLVRYSVRYSPWYKPLDVLVLIILIVAMYVWGRNGRDL